MQTQLTFATIILGMLTPVHDDDGITNFPSYRACVLYAIRRKVELEAIMRDNGLNERIEWRCAYSKRADYAYPPVSSVLASRYPR
jgi:hypothetical protein